MRKKDFTAKLADEAPSASTLTDYDEEHLLTYRGLLDAEGDGAEWDEAVAVLSGPEVIVRLEERPSKVGPVQRPKTATTFGVKSVQTASAFP